MPAVVDSGGGNHVLGGKAVRLEVPDLQPAWSGMQHDFQDLRGAGYTRVTVEYDVYREASLWSSNLWWYWYDTGDPTYGLMWDVAQAAYAEVWPWGFDHANAATPVVFDQWKTLRMTWDFTTNQATGSYGSVTFPGAPISDIATLTGWGMYLGHDEGTGSGGEVVWIDNFKVTGVGGCYANCDQSTTAPVLNVLDFNCFLNAFSAGASYANCDNSTQPPVLNVLDFNCFLNRFSAGCP
jgi:hypothetical protein